MIVCMPGTRKSHFSFLPAIPMLPWLDFDDPFGSLLAQSILILSAYCSSCSPRDLQTAFPFPPHQKLPLQLCLAVKALYSSLFSEYFCWVNSLWKKNKPTKLHKTTNRTKQTNKQTQQTRKLGSCLMKNHF